MHALPITELLYEALGKFRSTQIKSQNDLPFPEIPLKSRKFMTLRVAQIVLKIAHLAISMEPGGPRPCGLLPRFWLLVIFHSACLFKLVHNGFSANVLPITLGGLTMVQCVARIFSSPEPVVV